LKPTDRVIVLEKGDSVMMKSCPMTIGVRAFSCLMPLMVIATSARCSDATGGMESAAMVLVEGGTFEMGDVFGEGRENERPVHMVTLSDFSISKYEVTVVQFRLFVEETGYRTSAEAPTNTEMKNKLMQKAGTGELTPEEMISLKAELLQFGGTGFWDAEKRQWLGYRTDIHWRNPGFEQADSHPVQAVSPDDVMNYCNWMSTKLGLPDAYDLTTGELLDSIGIPTVDITKVCGFRLPTEAEWEYAARQRGQQVRFGNGKNAANGSEINFRADAGDYTYLEVGEYRMGTTPVGSFPANSLGLFDMSGNAWEWTGDAAEYTGDPRTNPSVVDGVHVLRGGRWGGDASEVRVFSRSFWPRNDRCNNSGFRIARSVN
jgi:formylglycine-generating enzyme required for sulfatase activity